MNNKLALLIRQYKEDNQSVYNTWFINNEERLKAFRSIRRGVMQVIDDIKGKKFPADFFDLVFIIAALFHLPSHDSRLALLQKIYKEMKTGGKLVVMVWNLASDWAKVKAKKDWKKIGDNDFLIPWKNPEGELLAERYYHHFTPDELKQLLLEAGFKVKTMKHMKNGTWTDDKGGQNLIAVAVK